MLLAVVMERHWSFHKMGIDMSAAFDTIQRSTILNLLHDAGCSEDDVRLVRFLLSKTMIKVCVDKTYSVQFETTLGSFQGDSLSGCLFSLVLAGALNHLRTLIPFRSNPPMNSITMMPEEDDNADDVYFIDEGLIRLNSTLPVATHDLKEWGLNVNESKTEFAYFFYAEKGQIDSKGKPVQGNELWRTTKKLGSHMCSEYDIQQKCILGNLAFKNYKDVWLQGKRICLPKLIKVYEAMVVSVMTYNCSSWAVPKEVLKKLDVCHRKHLRQILNIKWPQTISNKNLYDICNSQKLSERIRLARWKMFGHILRSPQNSPAALSLSYAVEGARKHKGRRGCHKINLLKLLRNDLSSLPIDPDSKFIALHKRPTLKNLDDIENLRVLAKNRSFWRDVYDFRLNSD